MGVRLATEEEIHPSVEPGGFPVRAAARGFNTAIADFLDLPGEFIASGLRTLNIDPSAQAGGFRALGGATGLTRDPGVEADTAAEAAGDFLGLTLPLIAAAPLGAGLKAADLTVTGLKQGKEILRGFFKQAGETAIGREALLAPTQASAFRQTMREVSSMLRFVGMESAAAALAGAAGHVAKERFPDTPAAEFVGNILGGLAPGAALQTAKLASSTPLMWLARKLYSPFSAPGKTQRVKERVRRAVSDPIRAEIEIREADVLRDVLTPAQASGEAGLMALEKSVVQSSAELTAGADAQIAAATKAIKDSLLAIGGGVPLQRTREMLEQAKDYAIGLMDTRLRIAAARSEERIAALAPGSTKRAANEIAFQEVDKARIAARATETEIWSGVEGTASLTKTRDKWLSILRERKKAADPKNIPDWIGGLLGRFNKKTGELKGGKLKGDQPIAELMGFDSLRSRLQQEAAIARAKGKYTKARFMDDLADAVMEDIDAAGSEATTRALDYSRALNDRFTRGPVAKVLKIGTDRGAKTPESLFLEATISGSGPARRENVVALEKAVNFAGIEAPELRGAIQDFIRGDFLRLATKKGAVNVAGARAFMKQYDEVLALYPELRADILAAISTGDTAVVLAAERKALQAGLSNPKVNRAAVFIRAPVHKEMARVASSQNPGKAARELVEQALNDPTGDAVKGLRTGFAEFLIATAQKKLPDGSRILSGQKLRQMWTDPRISAMARQFYPSREQQRRIETIINTAVRLEAGATAKPAAEGIIGDAPGKIVSLAGRFGGAALGRFLAGFTGGGTVQQPGMVAQQVREMMQAGVRDPASRLLVDMIDNGPLFRAMLVDSSKPAGERFLRRQLNAWAATVTAELFGEVQPERRKPPKMEVSLPL